MNKIRGFEILEYFNTEVKEILEQIFIENCGFIEEIRIRAGKPIVIQTLNNIIELKPNLCCLSNLQIEELFNNICDNSRYAYMNEIRNGFITINGGHRIGICGRAICDKGEIYNITDISSLNIRIANEKLGSADNVMKYIINQDQIVSSIIYAPPMVGKTTVLRDTARQLSNLGFKVGITDDRGELAGMYRGLPQNDIGKFTDIIENAPKDKAINMLLRSMSPDVIITDEISTVAEMQAVLYAVGTGVKVIATTHGSTPIEVINKPIIKPLIDSGEFTQLLGIKRRANIIEVSRYKTDSNMKMTVCRTEIK